MMCFIVQRRLTTVVRILIAVGFLVFIMCKYFVWLFLQETALQITTRPCPSTCLSVHLSAADRVGWVKPQIDRKVLLKVLYI